MQSLTEKTVRSHVLLSICAWGANFYRDENGRAFLKEQGLMTKWAKQAGVLVFQEAEDLHEDNIVTFCNLSLFWHSQGSWRISYLHKGNACQLLHIIGIGPQAPNSSPILEFEIRRRRFWACYLFHCFSSEKLFQFEAIADIHNLPLPWPEDDFEAGISRFPVSAINAKNGGGVFAELIRGLTLSCSVVSIVRSKDISFTSRLQEIFKVENEILNWWRGVAAHFKLDAAKVASVKQRELPKILLTNIVYHQSLCALHASIVPLFCWSEGDKTKSSARQLSAQIAFDHACEISRLINAVLATQCRLSAMPIFVAYAAYSGCAVQIPFLWCTELSVRERVQANVEANLKMIQGMSCYWKLASLLQVYVQCLHSVHKGSPPSISNEPKYADISAFTDFEIDASLAKSSILEFTGLLRSAEHGYTKPGEESHDLGTAQNEGDEILVGRDNVASASGDLFSESSNLPVDTIRPDPEVPLSPDRFVSGASEWPTLDVFSSLFDADMTSLLPQDQSFDLSFLNTDPVSWDLFDATGN